MSTDVSPPARLTPVPLPENIESVQPGGGVCYRLELAWGVWRRWWLRRFKPGYVERMARLRQGDTAGAPHPILDPRDLKYCRNRVACYWHDADDPFRWRGRIPIARWGLAELQLMGWPLAVFSVVAGWYWWPLALVPAVLLLGVVWFFRDPPRQIPQGPALVVSPADGQIVEISRLDQEEFIGGPAVRIGIFLSIFDVHLNRSPVEARVIALRYCPGKFFNALKPRSARENESMWIGLEEEAPPHRRLVVRQISGAIARRIVCDLRPGETIMRGQKIGMIKFGSRTELILPDSEELDLQVAIGQRVKAGSSVLAKYSCSDSAAAERPPEGEPCG